MARTQEGKATELAIGVDLGGTHVLAVLMDSEGTVHARQSANVAAADRGSQEQIAATMRGLVWSVWKQAGEHFPGLPIRGVGIAVPGNVDPKRGVSRYLPNFGWLEDVDLTRLILDGPATPETPTPLRELLRLGRVHMRNDGRCAALAERHFGVGSSGDHAVVAMLTLGTGIGGALVTDAGPTQRGAPAHPRRATALTHQPSARSPATLSSAPSPSLASALRPTPSHTAPPNRPTPPLERPGVIFDGCSFDAGDFGHHVMSSGADAFACVCGKRGCFETHASAAGLVRHWRAAGGEADISLDDARSVVVRMRSGEAAAVAAFEAYRADLATGLANLVTFYNPSLIILGGGLSR